LTTTIESTAEKLGRPSHVQDRVMALIASKAITQDRATERRKLAPQVLRRQLRKLESAKTPEAQAQTVTKAAPISAPETVAA